VNFLGVLGNLGGRMCPRKPRKPCSFPGCPELTEDRYCDKHKKEVDSEYNRTSSHYKHLYNSSRWRRLRIQFIRVHPLCEVCKRKGVVNAAEIVDHIKPHQGNEGLFWNESNWQALCKSCHDRKTAKEDGRWGRKGRIYS